MIYETRGNGDVCVSERYIDKYMHSQLLEQIFSLGAQKAVCREHECRERTTLLDAFVQNRINREARIHRLVANGDTGDAPQREILELGLGS